MKYKTELQFHCRYVWRLHWFILRKITNARLRCYRCVKLFPLHYSSQHICKSTIVNETGTVSVTRKFCSFINTGVDTITRKVKCSKSNDHALKEHQCNSQVNLADVMYLVKFPHSRHTAHAHGPTTACLKQALTVYNCIHASFFTNTVSGDNARVIIITVLFLKARKFALGSMTWRWW
jgi:hypothetical protein